MLPTEPVVVVYMLSSPPPLLLLLPSRPAGNDKQKQKQNKRVWSVAVAVIPPFGKNK